MKYIYSRSSLNRKTSFQIETLIGIEDNKKYVVKRALTEASFNHIKNIKKNEELLRNSLNPLWFKEGFLKDDKYIVPFAEGTTLSSMFLSGKENEALQYYKSIVNYEGNTTDFTISNEFSEIFGNVKIGKAKAFKVPNVDLSLDNVLVDGSLLSIIDLEWVFDFMIPISFIIYRNMKLFYEKNIHVLDGRFEELLKNFSLDIDTKILDEMCKSFDNYVICDFSHFNNYAKKQNYFMDYKETASKEINRLNDHIEDLSMWGKSLDKEIESKGMELRECYKTIEKEQLVIYESDIKIKNIENENESFRIELKDKSNLIIAKDKEIALNKEEIAINKKEIVQKNEEIKTSYEILKAKEEKIKEQEENIRTKEIELNRKNEELSNVYNSTGFRMLKKYYRVRDFFLPKNSKRRLLVKMTFKIIRHPFYYMKRMKPSNIKKFFKYLKSEGPDRVLNRVEGFNTKYLVNDDRSLELFEMKKRDNYGVLDFKKEKNPLVSIIIPVYNQFNYTYGCLESILKNTSISYEVIIADDNSSDETKDMSKYTNNVTVIRNKKNLGFLLNCKNAANHAKGKYVLFLNNDTNVQPYWLSTLYDLIEGDSSIGMVGSKLVYPDGRLQEAGGIIWKEASGWNYGRLADREASEYNYVKDADYISGASIMLSRKLWKEIGGFDERYVPAYFEDSDLAFEVRKHNKRVVFNPLSVVVHYEGISHGTNVKEGIKAYQVTNKEKFKEKWKNELEKQFPDAMDVFLARDRSKDKKCILVIDHYVPHYDKDAGSRTIFGYLKLFVSMGFNVKFIGDNYYRHEPYTTDLQKLGIEVLYGPYYANNWKEYILKNGKYIDFVMMNRPHITEKYIDFIKSNTKALIIYYGEDLHYLRMQREYELTKNNALLKEIDKTKKQEFSIMSKADLIYYPSMIEVNLIKELHPKYDVRELQSYMFDNVKSGYVAKERRDLLFVGGFAHGPNVDAVKWFCNDIFKDIVSKDKNIRLIVVGSNPPEEVKELGSNNVIIKGFVSDQELSDLYKSTRLVIAPLRYGAGVKGKIVEALANGVPVFTTSIGSEGLSDDVMFVDNEFSSLLEVYKNDAALNEMCKKGSKYILDNFTVEAAGKRIQHDFFER